MKNYILFFVLIFFISGCDNIYTTDSIDFDDWMSCSTEKEQTTGDLAWIEFDVSATENLFSGDTIILSIRVENPMNKPFSKTDNMYKSSTLRVFMENVNDDPTTIGKIGPEDCFLAEFIIPGLYSYSEYQIVDMVKIPKINSFGAYPLEEQEKTAVFKIYGMLDAQNCIAEADETNNIIEAKIDGSEDHLEVCNPYLPNLQIKYLHSSTTPTINAKGGEIVTMWEIYNAGYGRTKDAFNVSVYLSEDDVYDDWDVELGQTRVKSDIKGQSIKVVKVNINMPYVTWRKNGWTLWSSLEKYNPDIGDDLKTRESPPNGPPGYYFSVYPCIESSSTLIAKVDSDSSEVNESIETDNYSNMILGGNRTLDSINSYEGFIDCDIELSEFRAKNYYAGSNLTNALDIAIRYSTSIQFYDNCSFGFFWSKDDKAQFGDYFIQRYWFQIQPGVNILLYPFGHDFVWKPDPLPAPGTYRMTLMMDDIFKFGETDKTNNFKISEGIVIVR